MEELEYPDLPVWAQPKQKAMAISSGGASEVQIVRITRTQIVARDKHGHDRRYDRKPTKRHADGYGETKTWVDVRFRERGHYTSWLASPEEPEAHADLFRAALRGAVRGAWRAGADAMEQARMGKRTMPANLGDLEQWALEELDALENAAREARKKIETAGGRHRERAALYRAW